MRLMVLMAALVVALVSVPAAVAKGNAGGHPQDARAVRAAASPSACNDNAYTFLGPSARWVAPLAWRYRSSSVPAGLNSGDVLAVIKKSFKNIVNARNDCGMADNVSATHSYLGSTSKKPGVNSAGTCTETDGHSVIGFAALDGFYAGYTCIWWDGSARIIEMDMRLDPDQPWALSLAECSNELMMEALLTHELGHAYGLGHVGENRHGRLTMSVYIDGLCENQEANLGKGDILGLNALY